MKLSTWLLPVSCFSLTNLLLWELTPCISRLCHWPVWGAALEARSHALRCGFLFKSILVCMEVFCPGGNRWSKWLMGWEAGETRNSQCMGWSHTNSSHSGATITTSRNARKGHQRAPAIGQFGEMAQRQEQWE